MCVVHQPFETIAEDTDLAKNWVDVFIIFPLKKGTTNWTGML